MIEVRLFAGLRQGRQKVYQMEPGSVKNVQDIIEEGKVVIGGGACEIDLVKQLREYGESVSGREQLAILKYAEALEVIPRTLIENAGLDTINLIADLKAAHEDTPRVYSKKQFCLYHHYCIQRIYHRILLLIQIYFDCYLFL